MYRIIHILPSPLFKTTDSPGYMYMYRWVPSPFTWNYHNIVNRLYLKKKKKLKNADSEHYPLAAAIKFCPYSQNSDMGGPKVSPQKDCTVCCVSTLYLCLFSLLPFSTLLCVLEGRIWRVSVPFWLPLGFIWLKAPAGGHGLPPVGHTKEQAPVRSKLILSDFQWSLLSAVPLDLWMKKIPCSYYSQGAALYWVISLHPVPSLKMEDLLNSPWNYLVR